MQLEWANNLSSLILYKGLVFYYLVAEGLRDEVVWLGGESCINQHTIYACHDPCLVYPMGSPR